jgi:hypothetical protein
MRRACLMACLVLAASCSGDNKTPDQGVTDQQVTDQRPGADRGVPREARTDATKLDLRLDSGPPSVWKETSFSTTINAIWGLDSKTIFAVGKGGLIMRYDGTSWKTMPQTEKDDLYAVYGTSDSAVLAGGDAGLLAYDGTQWTKLSTYLNPAIRGIWSNNEAVYAVGKGGEMRCKAAGATYWSAIFLASSSGKDCAAIWGVGSDLYVVGAAGMILRCSTACTSSASWTAMPSNTTSSLQGVWGTASNDVFAVGLDGAILHYDGAAWSAMPSGTSTYFYGVWGTSSKDIYAVGNPMFKADEAILHYDGTSWSKLPPPKSGVSYFDVWAASPTDVWAVGQTGSILHYDGTKP